MEDELTDDEDADYDGYDFNEHPDGGSGGLTV